MDRRLSEVQPLLESLRELNSLEGALDSVRHVLEHPDDYFSLESVTLSLNRMGIKSDALEEGATTLQLEELVLGRDKPIRRALMPVRVRRESIAELRRQLGG